jgi:hypothetical protein
MPTVADNRTSNLLILRGPAADRPPVTAEVASSSLVVPAIHSKRVERSSLQPTRVRFRSEGQRKDRCLRSVFCWRDCLRVNIQRGP